MANNNWRVDIHYSCFADAVKMLKKLAVAGVRESTAITRKRLNNTQVCIAVKRTGYLIMAVVSHVTGLPAGCRITSHRSIGVSADEDTAISVPLPFLLNLSKKMGKKKNPYGYLALKVEGKKITGILEDNMFGDNQEDSAVVSPAGEAFQNILAEAGEWDMTGSGYEKIAQGDTAGLKHSIDVALMGVETDQEKIQSERHRKYARSIFLTITPSEIIIRGTNNEKMASSRVTGFKSSCGGVEEDKEGTGRNRDGNKSYENITLSVACAELLGCVVSVDSAEAKVKLMMRDDGKYLIATVTDRLYTDRSWFVLMPIMEKVPAPDWKKITVDSVEDAIKNRSVVTVDASKLITAVNTVRAVAEKEPCKGVLMAIKDGMMRLSAGIEDRKVTAQNIPVKAVRYDKNGEAVEGREVDQKLLLNVDYVYESILRMIDRTGHVTFAIEGFIHPVIVLNKSDLFILMPIYNKDILKM